jgi:hypothetical protein
MILFPKQLWWNLIDFNLNCFDAAGQLQLAGDQEMSINRPKVNKHSIYDKYFITQEVRLASYFSYFVILIKE